jgi:hypothetical protein
METSLVERPAGAESLARVLARVAANPEQSTEFHELLRPYCHKSRNILNSLNMILYLCRRSAETEGESSLASLESLYRDVERFIDRLHHFLRPSPLTLVRVSLGLLIEQQADAWSKRLAPSGRRLIVLPPSEAAIGQFDPGQLEKGFNDLVTWRAWRGSARTDLRVSWEAEAGWFRVVWDERPHRRKAMSPDKRREEHDGLEHLTVPLLTRIVSVHGGSLKVTDRPRWCLRMSWPLEVPSTLRDSS